MQPNPYARYQQTQVQTASPTQLVVMLYEGAVRFCGAAEQAARAHDVATRHTNLLKAQAIVAELSATLNHEQGGDIASNLERLYDYVYQRLVEANIRNDAEAILEARGLLNDLLTTWREVARLEQASVPGQRLAAVGA